jgi:hypothetical protein
MQMMCAEGSGLREQLDSFQPVGLSLAVLSVKNIYSGNPINLTCEVAEIRDFD